MSKHLFQSFNKPVTGSLSRLSVTSGVAVEV